MVISPYSYTGERMAQTLTRPHVQPFIDLALSPLGDGELDLQIEEIRVQDGSSLVGSSLRELDCPARLGVILLAIRDSGGRLKFNPGLEHTMSPGDYLIAMGDSQKLKQLEGLAEI